MLKSALNALTRIHSRTALLKRLGTVNAYSPCRITPSNYFRFLRGPEYTTITGVEFVIPLDSMLGEFSQSLTFNETPDAGVFKLKFDGDETEELTFESTAAEIQTQLRTITALANVVVAGSFSEGFTFTFAGLSSAPDLLEVTGSTLEEGGDSVTTTIINTYSAWSEPLKKGDRIIDGERSWAIDEIIEMHDVGAQVMAYRVRCD